MVDLPRLPEIPENTELRFPIDGGCFGCSPTHEQGLRLTFVRRGEAIASDYVFPDRFRGAPGVAHGGLLATAFDEVSCAAVYFLKGRFVVTGELTIRYTAPCPVEKSVEFRAAIVDDGHDRYAVVHAELRSGQDLLAKSQGKFFYQEIEGLGG